MTTAVRRIDLMGLRTSADIKDLLYGAVVTGASLAVISAHADGTTRVAISTFLVLIVYWLAHVYVDVLGDQLGGEDTRVLPRRLWTSLRTEASVLLGGIPVIAVYLLAYLLGAGETAAGFVALSSLVVLLFVLGWLGAQRAHLSTGAAVLEATGAGVFGVLIVALKAVLH